MKKILSIFSIALVALFAASCGTDEPAGDTKQPGVSFNIAESNVDSSSIEVVITPSDMTANYYADIVATADIAGMSDAELIDKWVLSGEHKVRKGVQPVAKSSLAASTSYTVVAFAITETEKATRKEYITKEAIAPVSPELFNVDIEVKDITATSAIATATPNGSNWYFFRVITKMELTAMGIYDSDYDVLCYILENPNNNDYIFSGNTTLTPHLNPEMDYIAVAFNVENWEAVYNKEQPAKLFRHEFKTPKVEYNEGDLFTFNNLQTTSSGFTVDVIPTRGDDSFWTYYIWTKQSYDETLASESSNNIVMRSYWALYNLAGEVFIYDFGQFMREKMGQTGSSRISNYEPLKKNTDYVVVLFYIDPNVGSDPTEVYEYKYATIDVRTTDITLAPVELTVSEPVIVKNGLKYDIQFNVKLGEDAKSLRVGTQLWGNYDFASYWNPNDWTSIEVFFKYSSKSISEDSLAEAKTAQGTTISISGADKNDYVVFFEALNSEDTKTQYGVRITSDMFDNAQ